MVNHFRADDGTRTRDIHLGKVMRYQLRYIRIYAGRNLPQGQGVGRTRLDGGGVGYGGEYGVRLLSKWAMGP